MADRANITPELCRQLLRYEPETGKLFWRERHPDSFRGDGQRPSEWNCAVWNKQRAGKEAMTAQSHGYRHGSLNGVMLRAHHVVWMIVHGERPPFPIDHINGDPLDNRICNLRSVPPTTNSKNRSLNCNNSSGFHGVRWHKRYHKWEAHIVSQGKYRYLGSFQNKEDAIAARKSAELELGFHANHGRRSA